MTFFSALPQERPALPKHLTAERKTEKFVAGTGVAVKWERMRRQNYWFDCSLQSLRGLAFVRCAIGCDKVA